MDFEETPLYGKSLFLFSGTNKFRKMLKVFIEDMYVETFFLSLIVLSSILLAMENPLSDPDTKVMTLVSFTNTSLTIVFTFEAICKLISYGFLLNGK